MYVVARRAGESFMLDGEYEIRVLDVRGRIARIGVMHKSRSVHIERTELIREAIDFREGYSPDDEGCNP